MGHNLVPHEGSAVKADPLGDKTFEAALAAVRRYFVFRWTWAEDEIQRLLAAGWDRMSEGELRYTFNTAEGDERGVNAFAEAYEQLEGKCGTAVRLVPGRVRSAIWVRTDLLMVLTSYQLRLLKPVGGRRSEDIDGDKRDDEVCECHCHCEAEGLDYCHDDDCGDYDECAEDDCEEHDCEEEGCERNRCDDCHCCTCWKNCGCGFYDSEECGCGCYECTCDCYSAILDLDTQSGPDEPVTVANQWPTFVAGLAQLLTRLGKGERVDLTAHGHRYARFQIRDHELDCAIAGNRSVPKQYHLNTDQSAWLINRGWYQYRESDRTYTVPFASNYEKYVTTAESVVTVLHDFLGITHPSELGIETTGAHGTPGAHPQRPLAIMTEASPANPKPEQADD
ncbi:TY-Chap domain-containing protein [Nocardia sp. NBC_01327]|uniref:TY-Chap domain-containing protein n=1 Tax=Nocardia sp. NBC_01327 TaxID=2903593 RepID=UPI002E0EC4D1|nr:hypothetical protein OG326_05970 [Nocardia sp. NBC_01327]